MAEDERVKLDSGKLIIGICLLILGIFIPYFLNVRNMGIYPDLYTALSTHENMYVVKAAFKLVMLNSLRSFPHYLGTFFCGEALNIWNKSWKHRFLKTLVLCFTIPLVYQMVKVIHGINYDFGIPAVLVICFIIIYWRLDFNMVNSGKKLSMIITIIMAIQWLDVMPSFSGYAFGRGELSLDIKNVALITEGTDFLQITALVFFLFFFLTALLLSKLIMDENKLMVVSIENEKNEKILMETRIRVLENRTYMEIYNLVHDLKSPLTSIQTLAGVIKMSGSKENEYLSHIEDTCERMSGMITEILDEDKQTPISTHALLTDIMAKISASEYVRMVRLKLDGVPMTVFVNQIRFTRAVINLLENAFYAVDKDSGFIELGIIQDENPDRNSAEIYVEDNGHGISKDQIDAVWEHGYSTRFSFGLGLKFVKKVVTDSGGEIFLKSDTKSGASGTRFTIKLPAEKFTEEGGNDQDTDD